MASYQEVFDLVSATKASVVAVDGKVDGVAVLVTSLRSEIAAGSTVSQAELDALGAEVAALKSGVDAVAAKLTAIV